MSYNILHRIYALPPGTMVLLASGAVALWLALGTFISQKCRYILNGMLAVFGFGTIIYATLIGRQTQDVYVSIVPFSTFNSNIEANEICRSLILNIIMFFPFCLGLAGTLPVSLSVRKRIGVVIAFALATSFCIELLQGVCSIGNAETDDIITNTIGAAISALIFAMQEKLRERRFARL